MLVTSMGMGYALAFELLAAARFFVVVCLLASFCRLIVLISIYR